MARTGLLLRVTPEERVLLGRAAETAGEPVAEWIREVAVLAAQEMTKPPTPEAREPKDPSRPLASVPSPRAPTAAPAPKASGFTHGASCACLACRNHRAPEAQLDDGLNPGSGYRCSLHKILNHRSPDCEAEREAVNQARATRVGLPWPPIIAATE